MLTKHRTCPVWLRRIEALLPGNFSSEVSLSKEYFGVSRKADEPAYLWLEIDLAATGFPMAFGVFQEHYSRQPEFQDSPNIAAIGTISSSIYFLGAPFATRLVTRFQRWQYHMVLGGTTTCILALLGASFARSVNVLIATQGVLYGTGFLFLYSPLLSMLNEWFVQRRGFAYAVVYAGGGFSGVGLPFLFEWLLGRWGFRGALRIFVVIQLVLIVPILPLLRGRLPVSTRATYRPIDLSFLKNPVFWLLTV
jgi:MFS family permease